VLSTEEEVEEEELLLLNAAAAATAAPRDLELPQDSHNNTEELGLAAAEEDIISRCSNSRVQSRMSSLSITGHRKALASARATVDFAHPGWPFIATKILCCDRLSSSSSSILCLLANDLCDCKQRSDNGHRSSPMSLSPRSRGLATGALRFLHPQEASSRISSSTMPGFLHPQCRDFFIYGKTLPVFPHPHEAAAAEEEEEEKELSRISPSTRNRS
jgi:hypothetical protein